MNKYTAIGLALEALKGRKLTIVVVPRQDEVRQALAVFEQLDSIDSQATIKRTNGGERINFHNGSSILFRSARQSLRGVSADLIYIEEDVVRHTLTSEQWERYRMDVMPVLNARAGELIIGY